MTRRGNIDYGLVLAVLMLLAGITFAVIGPPKSLLPMPSVVREPFSLYIQGPLTISYDFMREAGGEPVAPLFKINSVCIERSSETGEVVMSIRSGETEWFVNLDDSQRNWVLELSPGEAGA